LVLTPTEENLIVAEDVSFNFLAWSYVIIALIKLLLNKSLKTLWETLDTIQLIYFLKYANVLLPFMLENILDFFNFTANLNSKLFKPYIEDDPKTPEGFFNQGLTSV
jgi:hypothetical protein